MAIDPASPSSVETVTTLEAFEALARRVGRPRPRDAAAEPVPAARLARGVVAPLRRRGRARRARRPRATGRLVGALPLVVRRRAGLRVASFMGGRLSVLPDVLLAPDAARARRRADRRLAAGGCDVADFHGLPADSRIGAALGARLGRSSASSRRCSTSAAGWDAVYRAKTNAKKRNLHRRRRRQLAELGRPRPSRSRARSTSSEPALEEAFPLHALRWEGRPDGSGFATDVGQRFHRAALRRLAAIDVARIVTLRLDGRAIAFHYWFALADRMYVHRLAFDPALRALFARARQHARRDRGRHRRGAHPRRVPRRRRALQARARGRFRAALRRLRRRLRRARLRLRAAPSSAAIHDVACGSSAHRGCAASTSRASRRHRGRRSRYAVEALAYAMGGEPASRDEAGDRSERRSAANPTSIRSGSANGSSGRAPASRRAQPPRPARSGDRNPVARARTGTRRRRPPRRLPAPTRRRARGASPRRAAGALHRDALRDRALPLHLCAHPWRAARRRIRAATRRRARTGSA